MSTNSIKEIEEYYDKWTPTYLEDFGTYFQALQTTVPSDLMKHVVEVTSITKGMTILDAGCGVCGPAIDLAKLETVYIDAITLSQEQIKTGAELVENEKELKGQIRSKYGDYHNIGKVYGAEKFDLIYFLESLSHSNDPEK